MYIFIVSDFFCSK